MVVGDPVRVGIIQILHGTGRGFLRRVLRHPKLQLKLTGVEQASQRHDKYDIVNKVLKAQHHLQQSQNAYPVS